VQRGIGTSARWRTFCPSHYIGTQAFAYPPKLSQTLAGKKMAPGPSLSAGGLAEGNK